MELVWDEPANPPSGQPGRTTRDPQLREEVANIKVELKARPGMWARLWDLPDKDEANRRRAFASSKGFSCAVRATEHGYSVFMRFNGDDTPDAAVERESTFSEDPTPNGGRKRSRSAT